LDSISCTSATFCAAVGEYDSYNPAQNADYQNGLLEVYSDGQWTPTEGSLPLGPDSGLVNVTAVSCGAVGSCVALGLVSDTKNSEQLLVYTLQSGTWTMQSMNVNSKKNFTVSGISCPNAQECVGVGSYEDSKQVYQGLIFTLSSGRSGLTESPFPANALTAVEPGVPVPGERLSSISCPAVDSCVVGGFYIDANGNQQPLLLTLASGSWSAAQAPVPADSQANTLASINSVTCWAIGNCVAAGAYFTNWLADNESGMLLDLSGGVWAATTAPPLPNYSSNETGGNSVVLYGASCIPGQCTAVGYENSYSPIPLSETAA
jgi:hypothetical protein